MKWRKCVDDWAHSSQTGYELEPNTHTPHSLAVLEGESYTMHNLNQVDFFFLYLYFVLACICTWDLITSEMSESFVPCVSRNYNIRPVSFTHWITGVNRLKKRSLLQWIIPKNQVSICTVPIAALCLCNIQPENLFFIFYLFVT